MLSIEALKSCRARELPLGAFARLTSGDQEPLVIASIDGANVAVVFGKVPFLSERDDLDGDALFTVNWRFDVDPTSARSANQVTLKDGHLVVDASGVRIPVKAGGGPRWDYARFSLPSHVASGMTREMAFSRWKIVTVIGECQHVWFEMNADDLTP